MKKILLILTGGTIGSRIDSEGNISPTALPLLLSLCKDAYEDRAEFTVSEPFCCLSENMTVAEREGLIKEINAHKNGNFDGVIVAHGSDTLCYTAALCAMVQRDFAAPIVFIAADYVLSDPRTNGKANFKSAVDLICDGTLKRGTFICYRDDKGGNSVYLPTRLGSAEPIFDAFTAFDKTRLGKIEQGRFVYESSPLNPTVSEINAEREAVCGDDFTLTDKVLLIHSSPYFDPLRLELTGIEAVINYGYHCGTVNENSFFPFVKRCEQLGITVYMASFKDPEAPIYESLAEILTCPNVKRLYNLTPEAATAKVLLAHSVDMKLLDEELYFEEIAE